MKALSAMGCLGAILVAICGCGTTTPHTVNTTVEFNIGLHRALNEQLLLNLVRMRFREPALFLNPKHLSGEAKVAVTGAINPSLEVDGGGGFGFGSLLPGVAATREYSPMISFSHVSGESQHYHEQVTMELLNHLLKAEWNIEVLLRVFVERLNDIKNDPRNETKYLEFMSLAKNLKSEQDEYGLVVTSKTVEENVLTYVPPPPSPPETPKSRRAAVQADPVKPRLTLQLSLDELIELEEKGYEIGLSTEKLVVSKKREVGTVLRSLNPSHDDPSRRSPIVTRSFYDALFFLAQGIEVPSELQASVKSYGKAYETSVRQILTVKWADSCPENAYIQTEYKGYCWYIEDLGPSGKGGSLSKDTISLLQMVYMLQGTDVSGRDPVLSVVGL